MGLDDVRSAGITEGLVEQKVSAGTLIGFATQPEHVAYDGPGDNGYFTEALLRLQDVLDGKPGWVLYSPTTVPEPSTWAMMLLGFAGVGFAGYRRARAGRGMA